VAFSIWPQLLASSLDLWPRAGSAHDGRVVTRDGRALGAAEICERRLLQLAPELFGNHPAASQDRDVLDRRSSLIAEAGRLHRRHLEPATELVDHKRGQEFALDVLGDDQERPAALNHGLEHREQGLQPRQLLVV
jgi:hypothetical protein